jgi:diguanylate cyclase (GGDEF)-like protein
MGMKTGFLFWTCGAYVILILITAGITTYRGFRKIFRNENINSVPLMFLSVSSFLWFVSGILDVLTAVRVIDLPPLSWIGSIVIVLTIAFVLIITIENLCDKVQNLYKELIHDNLTNAYSKSFFEISFNAVYNNLCRNDSKNFLVLFDVDDFKKVNDKSGHLFGDHVLKELIDIVKSGLRSSDIVARFGGDEFLVLIKDCEETNDIIAMIDRVREKVSEYIFESGKKRSKITCSFGVTVFDSLAVKSNLTYDEIFATADLALYKSKENGKNMITVMDLPNK